jgi:hypothetical protein
VVGWDEPAAGREAYYADATEGMSDLLVIARVEPNVPWVRSLAQGGSTIEYVTGFLTEFLARATDDPVSLIPELAYLPVGWELETPVRAGIMLEIVTTPSSQAHRLLEPDYVTHQAHSLPVSMVAGYPRHHVTVPSLSSSIAFACGFPPPTS